MEKVKHHSLADESSLSIISQTQARTYSIIPIQETDSSITFLSDKNNTTSSIQNELEVLLGKKVILNETETNEITELLNKYYPNAGADQRNQIQFYDGEADSFIYKLIEEARKLKSSDIHIETYEEYCRVRIRIDGLLVPRYAIQKNKYPALINKVKILANLDIAEKRLPQDGRIFFENDLSKFDIRVSVLPTLYGEKLVLRLLSQDSTKIEINSLGFEPRELSNYLEGIKKPNGMILISGPTGSGKTTTLYATLKILNKETRNIVTIEDPIEYTLEGINQVQLKENIGFTFAKALKTFLRQDPDVIMLGEIRDSETATMAVRASLTGHLVLSTIHTNSAWGIVSRLIDMNIPSFLIADTLNTVVAQRLIRLLCPSCKKESSLTNLKTHTEKIKVSNVETHFIPVGCSSCYNTGYKGRTAIYEVIPIDSVLVNKIRNNASDIDTYLKNKNIKSLKENAFELFSKGVTSFEEIAPIITT
jgi:type IV pilus assembly protein PilB